MGDAPNAGHKLASGNVAANDSVKAQSSFFGDMLCIFRYQDHAATPRLCTGKQSREVRAQARSHKKDRSVDPLNRDKYLLQTFALGDDAHIVLQREDACRAGPEYRLIIGENNSIHESANSYRENFSSRIPPHRQNYDDDRENVYKSDNTSRKINPWQILCNQYTMFLNPEAPKQNRI
jgi:hypothetical protein